MIRPPSLLTPPTMLRQPEATARRMGEGSAPERFFLYLSLMHRARSSGPSNLLRVQHFRAIERIKNERINLQPLLKEYPLCEITVERCNPVSDDDRRGHPLRMQE
jgi:hypothetical protein